MNLIFLFASPAGELGYKVGYFLGYISVFLFPVLLIAFVIWGVMRFMKRRTSNS